MSRLLNPLTVVRQSIQVRDAYDSVVTSPAMTYDPVARVISIFSPDPANAAWLTPDLPYKVVFGIPDDGQDVGGLRAIDGATLDPGDPMRVVGFMATAPAAKLTVPSIVFCNDIQPLLQLRCASSACHAGGAAAVAALDLGTSSGIRSTAIGRVAHGSNTGPQPGPWGSPGHLFGVNMPIIDPTAPGNSWLLYKLMMAPPPSGAPDTVAIAVRTKCNGAVGTPPVPHFEPATFPTSTLPEAERAALRSHMLGSEMPYPTTRPDGTTSNDGALSFDELERVRLWIAEGAKVDECGACE